MTDIHAYFLAFDISDLEEREDFVYFIKELDAEFLKLEAQEIENKRGHK